MAVSRRALDAYRSQVGAYADAAAAFVEEYVTALSAMAPGASAAELREAAIGAIWDSLSAFGDQAVAVALGFLEDVAASRGVPVETAAEDVVGAPYVEGGVRYAARRLLEGDVAGFAGDVADLSRYYVHRSAFENLAANCGRNGLRYARVPSGRETCAFCFMLASRGFVYRTARSAGEGHAYHRSCDCTVVPGFDGVPWDEQVEGYDPGGMAERWRACRDAVGGEAAIRSRWDAMGKAERARYEGEDDHERYRRFANAQVFREVETRDWRWLNTGDVPKLTFESRSLEQETIRTRPQEIATANRLRQFGIDTRFVKDSTDYLDQETGCVQHVGLADFASGYEIKTLESATSYNTINGYLKNTSKKQNARFVCFDNSAGAIDDGLLIEYLERSRSFRRGRVYIIDSDGMYRFIR